MAHACLTSHQVARRGSPELPAQLLEEKADGEEAQGGRGGEHASAVVLQVPPQAASEGLWGRGLEGGWPGTGHGHQAQNQRTTSVREKVGPPPPSLGLRFPRNGHLRVTRGHPARPEAQAHCKLPQASCTRNLHLADPGQLGCVHRHQLPKGLWPLRPLWSQGHWCLGRCPGAWPQHSSHTSRRSAGALQRKRQAPRRPLSCPPSQTVNTAVLSGFPSALPAPLRPILESEPRHITPAALLRCPSEKGPAQCLRSLSGLTPQPPHPIAAHCPGGLPSVCTDDKAFRQTCFSPAPGTRRGPGSTCSLHTTGLPPAPGPQH